MPITVDERDQLRQLVSFTTDELDAAGNPDNSLKSLQALTDQRMAEYQSTVDQMEADVWALIDADPTGQVHQFWLAAQNAVWVRLEARNINIGLLMETTDDRVRRLAKSLPKLASLQWTITNFQGG